MNGIYIQNYNILDVVNPIKGLLPPLYTLMQRNLHQSMGLMEKVGETFANIWRGNHLPKATVSFQKVTVAVRRTNIEDFVANTVFYIVLVLNKENLH